MIRTHNFTSGICPFGGVMLISKRHGIIGIYCGDGTYPLHLKQVLPVYDKHVLLVQYSISTIAPPMFKIKVMKHSNPESVNTHINPSFHEIQTPWHCYVLAFLYTHIYII